jgi:hypothetical protein
MVILTIASLIFLFFAVLVVTALVLRRRYR